MIVLRRLRGAMYNWQHLSLLEDAEADGRHVPDEVRQMLHKKWLLVASTWAATEADSPDEDAVLKKGHRVRDVDGRMGKVIDILTGDNGDTKYLVQLSSSKITEMTEEVRHVFDSRSEGGMVEVQDADIIVTRETREKKREYFRDELEKEGDIERMERLFHKFALFKQTPPVQRWGPYFESFDDFFPEKDRRAMYILGATADPDDIEDLVWIMQQLKNMERKQHEFRPACCRGNNAETDLVEPPWMLEQRQTASNPNADHRALGTGLSLDPANLARHTELTAAGSTRQSKDAALFGADDKDDEKNRGMLRRSITQRESRLEAWMRARLREEQRERRKNRRTCDRLLAYCAITFFGTRTRSSVSAFVAAGSIFLTVFAVVHVAAFYTKDDADCSMKLWGITDDVIYSDILFVYWTFMLVVLPLVLLWLERCKPCENERVRELRARVRSSNAGIAMGNVVNFVSQTAVRNPASSSLAASRQAGTQNESDDGNGRGGILRGSRLSTSSMAAPELAGSRAVSSSDSDDYDDGGIDNPNWMAERQGQT